MIVWLATTNKIDGGEMQDVSGVSLGSAGAGRRRGRVFRSAERKK